MFTTAIELARRHIAGLAERDGEHKFAREVLAGAWDHRRDVQTAMKRIREEARGNSGEINV